MFPKMPTQIVKGGLSSPLNVQVENSHICTAGSKTALRSEHRKAEMPKIYKPVQ